MTQEIPSSGSQIIKEEVSTRAIEALMSNYRDAQQALLELVDNAVDNRMDGKPLLVRVRVAKDELAVFNQGGKGLDFKGLQNFFVWGHSEKTKGEIGYYGVGGKAAMGYLGQGMEVVCSSQGSNSEYRVSDPDWESRGEEWKQFTAEERKAATQEGYFRVKISKLKREVNAKVLSAKLADIYRPLLLDRSVKILVNGKEVEPLEIKYIENDLRLKPQLLRIQTRFGDSFLLKVGVSEEGQKVKPGIRCYYRGRLITEEEFFGHPTPAQMPQSSRLIGEAHLDFVPVTTNKASFDKSTPQWDNVSRRMHDILAPWTAKLQTLKITERSRVESYEQDLAKETKRIVEHVFATTGLVTKKDLPGESFGRLPPKPSEVIWRSRAPGSSSPKTEGQTAPLLEATAGETIKRWGAFYKVEVVGMGTVDRRADVIDESGRQVLKINSDFPLYQAAKKAGDDALKIYLVETGIMKVCQIVAKDKSVDEYIDLENRLLNESGVVLKSRIREKGRRSSHS